MKILIEYRELFYSENVKIIPINFLKENFTPQSLAYLFMDDGNKNGKTINLNLQCFEKENLIEFTNMLREKFNLEFNIKKDKTLYLRHRSREIFYNLISPFLTNDTIYKLDGLVSSLNSVNLGKS